MQDGTLKVTPITAGQPQASATFVINVILDGFPVQVSVEGKADALRGMIDRLKAIGAQPPSFVQNGKPAELNNTDDAPICEFHGKMKKGNYGFFCPKKMGDGSYCKSKA
jgi:hypothetical protein